MPKKGRVVVHGLLVASLLTKIASEMHYMARTFECVHGVILVPLVAACRRPQELRPEASPRLLLQSAPFSIAFLKPVFSGDTVTCTCTLLEIGEGAACAAPPVLAAAGRSFQAASCAALRKLRAR